MRAHAVFGVLVHVMHCNTCVPPVIIVLVCCVVQVSIMPIDTSPAGSVLSLLTPPSRLLCGVLQMIEAMKVSTST